MFDLKDFLKPFPEKGKRLLEINPCSRRLNLYKEAGFEITALDMDLNNLEICLKLAPGTDLKYGSLLSSPFGHSERFNVIVFFNVLSGMMFEEAKSFIYSVGSTLHDKGLAVFSMPSDDYKPPWWTQGDNIPYGKIACSAPYTGEVFCEYGSDSIRKFMLDFVDLSMEETNGLKILKAVKF